MTPDELVEATFRTLLPDSPIGAESCKRVGQSSALMLALAEASGIQVDAGPCSKCVERGGGWMWGQSPDCDHAYEVKPWVDLRSVYTMEVKILRLQLDDGRVVFRGVSARPCPACTRDGQPTGRRVRSLGAIVASAAVGQLDPELLEVQADKLQDAGDPLGHLLALWLRRGASTDAGEVVDPWPELSAAAWSAIKDSVTPPFAFIGGLPVRPEHIRVDHEERSTPLAQLLLTNIDMTIRLDPREQGPNGVASRLRRFTSSGEEITVTVLLEQAGYHAGKVSTAISVFVLRSTVAWVSPVFIHPNEQAALCVDVRFESQG